MKEPVGRSDRSMPDTTTAARQQHQIPLKYSNHDASMHDSESNADSKCLSPLSPTLSETSSVSSSSPVPSSRKYARKEKIGQGAQGSVYRCIEVATGKEVAVKIIMTHELSPVEIEAIKREVKTIKKLHHRHLVEYYKATEKKTRQLSIYMEFVAGGSLSSKLRQNGALALPLAKQYTRQLCEALQHLHENRIAHRDIKCANVFLTSSGEHIKVGDFGAFKEVGSVSLVGGLKGTPHWMAPEVIRAEQHTSEDGWFKADIWSLGCAVIEMLTGHSPWQQYSNPLTAMYQIVSSNNTPTIPVDASEETASFLKLCLQRNPEARASVSILLKHPFVQHSVEPHCPQTSQLPAASSTRIISEEPHTENSPVEEQAEIPTESRQNEPNKLNKPNEDAVAREPLTRMRKNSTMTSLSSLLSPKTRIHRLIPREEDKISATQKLQVQQLGNPTNVAPASSTRPSLRKPSIVPRLKALDLVQSPSNQEKVGRSIERHHQLMPSIPNTKEKPMRPMPPISRGVSACALGSSLPMVDAKGSATEIPIKPVRLRRLSTAPAASREPEEILSCMPPAYKLKLPPLSARPSSSSSGGFGPLDR